MEDGKKRDLSLTYFRDLLHPGEVPESKVWDVGNELNFIVEHSKEFIARFQKVCDEKRENGEEVDEQRIAKSVLDELRTQILIRILHPNYEDKGLSQEEQYKIGRDEDFMLQHIDEIFKRYNDMDDRGEIKDEHESMKEVMKEVKIDYYLDLLYPNHEGMSAEEIFDKFAGRGIVRIKFDDIDRLFEQMVDETEMQCEPVNEQAIMKRVMDEVNKSIPSGLTLEGIQGAVNSNREKGNYNPGD